MYVVSGWLSSVDVDNWLPEGAAAVATLATKRDSQAEQRLGGAKWCGALPTYITLL